MESLWQQAFLEDMPGGRRTCSEATSAGPQGLAMGWVGTAAGNAGNITLLSSTLPVGH